MPGLLPPIQVDSFALIHVPTAGIYLLWLAACIGHVTIAVWSHNWWYGAAIPRPLTHLIRLVHYVAILAGPVVLWFAFTSTPPLTSALSDVGDVLQRSTSANHADGVSQPGALGWRMAFNGYVYLCWIVCLLVLPMVTARRRLRRTLVLLSNHTNTVDVSARLGYKPVARKGHHWLARLPGNEIFQVDMAEKTLCLARLPAAWEGLEILHLSDLHLRGTPDKRFFYHVMDLCAQWQPDLVALTGDIVDSIWHHRWIMPVLGRLRWRVGAFAILGNHDYWYDPVLIRRRLRRAGMQVLGNTWQQIEVRGQPMIVIGHEGPWFQPEPDLSACPADHFRLCLSHTPDNIGWARRHHMDLMLSGHNHGGQIRLPLLGSVFVPSKYGRRYDCGTFDETPTVLHVSRGLGEEHPVRYNCRPEVTKIVLKRK